MSDDVKVELTPSQELVGAANAEVTVADAKGRQILLKKPGTLAQFRLVELMGDSARNVVYMNMVLPLIFVASIDGDPVAKSTKAQIEALIQRLDDEGVEAVAEGVQANWGKQDPAADKAAVKN
ncbi:hypothetical protein ISN76_12905 [Dyella halodurans]|uniref:Tail assembly chaperone n=1 Tax=Dyella halodurans TaxID=1920171 RepID=A0ABV9C0K1_9GAMM|nr:hypothetical protein [Dyella halodurans]